ncbi:unnamed protein product [Orchesella dallaii]|uniref:Odorant receptor n=1 Tax=Orchesella dallaii TaxID=48710 RepID=A0ABP1RI75_9HEXA
MLSKAALRLFKWRFKVMKYAPFNIFTIDPITQNILISHNNYKEWLCLQAIAYEWFLSLIMFIQCGFVMMGYYSENGKWDIWDTDFKETNNTVITSLMCITDLIYAGGIYILSSAWLRVLQTKTEIAELINKIVDEDAEYRARFGNFLEHYRPAKLQQERSAALITFILFATSIFSVLFGFACFNPFAPDHRFLENLLEIPVKYDLFIVFYISLMDFCATQVAFYAFLIIMMPVLYFGCFNYWLYLLEPVSSTTVKNKEPMFVCRLGCTLTEEEVFVHYREQERNLLLVNNFFGHFLVTQHQAWTLLLVILASFVCVRHYDQIFEPFFLLVPTLIISLYTLQYFETSFVVMAYENSIAFMKAIKTHSRVWPRQRRNCIWRDLQALKPLQGEFAYPYFHLSRTSFLEFHSETVDNLVSLLVSIQLV